MKAGTPPDRGRPHRGSVLGRQSLFGIDVDAVDNKIPIRISWTILEALCGWERGLPFFLPGVPPSAEDRLSIGSRVAIHRGCP